MVAESDPAVLARIARLRPEAWNRMAPTIRAFFTATPDGAGLVQRRLMRERDRASSLGEKRSSVGRIGGLRSAAKRLKTQEAAQANACGLLEANGEQAATPHPQSLTLPPSGGNGAAPRRRAKRAEAQAEMPMLRVLPGGTAAEAAAAGPAEPPDAAVRRQLWEEGYGIVARLCPRMSDQARRVLIGWGTKALGNSPARMVQALRDTESLFAEGRFGGDGERAIRGVVHERAGTGRAARERDAAEPTAHQSADALLAAMERRKGASG